jgi:hypothetical protein
MNFGRQRDIYDVELLDDIHHLFPEILYDNTLFPHDSNDRFGNTLSWIRYRLSNLFPQSFTRARQEYTQNLSAQRRSEFDEWLWLRRGAGLNLQPQQFVHAAPVMSPLQASLNTNPWSIPIRQPAEESLYRRNPNIIDRSAINQIIQNATLEEFLGQLIVPRTTVRANLNGFFDAVPVRPTDNEINVASEIISSDSNLATEATCAICQDHDSPRDVSGSNLTNGGWRFLRGCRHIFHKNCIDRWFENHVICPVCRADIREFARQQTNLNQNASQSVEGTPTSDH